jgi:hypothetical protein
MWWASAGEQLRSEQQEEASRDAALLADLGPSSMSMPRPSSRSEPLSESLTSLTTPRRTSHDSDEARVELAIIAYFHRLTTQILSVLGDLADSQDEPYTDHDDDEDLSQGSSERTPLRPTEADLDDLDADAIRVDSHAVENMGLDVWSDSDSLFVRELSTLYFGRSARIEGKGVEVCGVRVC